ncbi:palmitoyltransferase ZDHHC18-A [Chanos chanos]|uniref:GPI mannosyltransferase 2 n=1 Tax=Chanos chanos TaxID=29144 RepID=A0A6J2W240_CHACN|nr:GPI mannosyltransferase 2 [Chanos chanos]
MDEWTVVQFAAITRAISLLLQAILNAVIPDHAADAFSPPRLEEPRLFDPLIEVLLGGLCHWDSEHFLFIAERGYLYEHNFAFFPLFPITLRSVTTTVLWPLNGWLTVRGRLLLAVALGNSVLFLLSAVALYRLGCLVLQDRCLAFISSLLYCLTPANVFMVVGYSECLFATLTFGGLWLLEKEFILKSSLLFGLATAARANGLVNAGFLLYSSLRRGFVQARVLSTGARSYLRYCRYIWTAICLLLTSAVCVSIVFLPFGLFQNYAYQIFCKPSLTQDQISPALLRLSKEKGYRVPDATKPTPSWCHNPVPLVYSYIQDVYWDVGFLRYFQLKQIPNFLLALPIAILGFMASFIYITANPVYCLCLGLLDRRTKQEAEKPTAGFFNPKVFVYIVHASALLIFGIFCMHVQVLTRFLASSSPVIYWISAHLLLQYEPLLKENQMATQGSQQVTPHQRKAWACMDHNPVTQLVMQWRTCSLTTRCILGYFISYWLIGLALHCNFLPWT